MSCQTCESLKEQFGNAVKFQADAEGDFRFAVIRGDGSSGEAKTLLDQAEAASSRARLQVVEHQRSH